MSDPAAASVRAYQRLWREAKRERDDARTKAEALAEALRSVLPLAEAEVRWYDTDAQGRVDVARAALRKWEA